MKLLKFKFNVIYIPASITCVQHQAASAQLAACAAQGHRNNQPAAAGLSLRRLRQQQERQEQGHRQGQIGNGSHAAGTLRVSAAKHSTQYYLMLIAGLSKWWR